MMTSIDQQIEWLERQVRHQRKLLPQQVEAGRMTEEGAVFALACASSALQTLTQLRALTRSAQAPKGAQP